MKASSVIALDLGGTKLAGALCSPAGKLAAKSVIELSAKGGREVGQLIVAQAARLFEEARARRIRIGGVGVCVPGISYQRSGTVWAPNLPGWKNYPLRKEIEAGVDAASIRVRIDSDRACSILGERWRGAARGARHAIFLAVGTGIGAGILVDGQILRGAQNIAGAIGWMALDRPFRPEYVACGCFEYHASGQGLAKVARELGGAKQTTLTARDIFAGYERGEKLARRVVARGIEFWGMATANLVSLFNPEVIVFGGGVFGPAQRFLPAIAAEAQKWAQPVAIRRVRLVASRLGGDAGLLGAAWQAREVI